MQNTEGKNCLNAINLTLKHGFCGKNQTVETLSAKTGVPMKDFFFIKQVHGNDVVIAEEETYLTPADAVIDTKGVYKLVIRTADCLPVLIQSKSGQIKAAVHAGWPGLLAGILEKTVERMRTLSTEPLSAALGPCLQKKHFEVKSDMIGRFAENIRNDPDIFVPMDGKVFFDMPKLAVRKLNALGLTDISMDCCVDTYAGENYYSYRRSTHKGEKDDRRQISWI